MHDGGTCPLSPPWRELNCLFLPQRHVEISFLQNPFFVSEKHFIFGA